MQNAFAHSMDVFFRYPTLSDALLYELTRKNVSCEWTMDRFDLCWARESDSSLIDQLWDLWMTVSWSLATGNQLDRTCFFSRWLFKKKLDISILQAENDVTLSMIWNDIAYEWNVSLVDRVFEYWSMVSLFSLPWQRTFRKIFIYSEGSFGDIMCGICFCLHSQVNNNQRRGLQHCWDALFSI